MKMLKGAMAIIVAAVVVTMVFGCSKAKSHVQKIQDLQKKACACTDKACAEAALKDFAVIYEGMKKSNASGTEAELKQIHDASKATTECIVKQGVTADQIKDIFK